jgi:hypothetical protein
MNDPRDTTGVWYGRYFATAWDVPENSFIAHLEESGGAVEGRITEPDDTGNADIRRAFVSGTRSVDMLEFVKQYDPAGPLAHSVAYSGRISADGTEITGDWRFSGYHGSFVMNREIFSAEELDEDAAVDEELVIELGDPAPPAWRL